MRFESRPHARKFNEIQASRPAFEFALNLCSSTKTFYLHTDRRLQIYCWDAPLRGRTMYVSQFYSFIFTLPISLFLLLLIWSIETVSNQSKTSWQDLSGAAYMVTLPLNSQSLILNLCFDSVYCVKLAMARTISCTWLLLHPASKSACKYSYMRPSAANTNDNAWYTRHQQWARVRVDTGTKQRNISRPAAL